MKMPVFLPNRTKLKNELTRRYEEASRFSEKGIHNDEDAQQFINTLAHYVYYVKKNPLTQQAIEKLFKEQKALADDAKIILEAEKIIEELKTDRGRLVRIARSKGINTDEYEFRDGVQQITGDMEFSFYITQLNSFLDRDPDAQLTSEVPGAISNLLSMVFAIRQLSGNTRTLQKIQDDYRKTSSEYTKKLKLQGVYLDYLRTQDYLALETVWKEVYREGTDDELLLFHVMYGDLFESNRTYQNNQIQDADNFVSKHESYLRRIHNYLIDSIDDVPRYEKFVKWTANHFGPTVMSLLLLVFILWFLRQIGININFDELKSITGL